MLALLFLAIINEVSRDNCVVIGIDAMMVILDCVVLLSVGVAVVVEMPLVLGIAVSGGVLCSVLSLIIEGVAAMTAACGDDVGTCNVLEVTVLFFERVLFEAGATLGKCTSCDNDTSVSLYGPMRSMFVTLFGTILLCSKCRIFWDKSVGCVPELDNATLLSPFALDGLSEASGAYIVWLVLSASDFSSFFCFLTASLVVFRVAFF